MNSILQWINWFIDFVLHMDKHLPQIVNDIGIWAYLVLFVIIFIETGLVVTPFLPGDSLLFAAGAVAATTHLDPIPLFLLLALAAILGDTANYWIGHYLGPKVFNQKFALVQDANTWNAPTPSTKSTAARPSCWRASSPSSAPSRPSWPASGA